MTADPWSYPSLASTRSQLVRVSFAKVAEYQVRGVIHFHAIIRLDGPPTDDEKHPAPSADVDSAWLADLVREAVASVEYQAPPVSPAAPGYLLRFGNQVDARPVHHLIDFRIIKRTGGAGRVLPYEQGPKDVVYVGEGETVHLLMKFHKPGGNTKPSGDPTFKGGRCMVHCHNLPHEDHDMMAQFSVGKVDYSGIDPHDPINSARPQRNPTFHG